MSTFWVPAVDSETKLFPQPTMDALAQALGANPEDIEAAVNAYLSEHPPAEDEPLLAEHINDATPHPAYDDIPSLSILFENGLL